MNRFFRSYGICCILFALPIGSQWADYPVISEIRYDERAGSNEEFVELYNPTAEQISLKNWSLQYLSKEGDVWRTKVTFSEGHDLLPLGYFLWGGDAVSPVPDVAETNQRSVGLSNSGGHIALFDSLGRIIDLIAWKGGLFPEGSGDAGYTGDGGSLERKASAASTSASLSPDGEENHSGNGFDTDDNALDFVIQPPEMVFPQSSKSQQEPDPRAFFGAGRVFLTPVSAFSGEQATLDLRIQSEPECLILQAAVILPWPIFNWTGRIHCDEGNATSFFLSASGDTLFLPELNLFGDEFIEITIESETMPRNPGDYEWAVLTATEENHILKPVRRIPVLRVARAPVSIQSLHMNDSEGVSMFLGDTVTVRGVVTAGSGLFSPAMTDVFIQDSTGGILIFDYQQPVLFEIGDSLTVTATVDQFHGMTELIPFWNQIIVHPGKHAVPEPVDLTCHEVSHSFHEDGREPFEGLLVRLNNVLYDPAAMLLTDTTGSCTLYPDPDSEIEPAMGRCDVTGLLTQHKPGNTDPGPPYQSDYRVQPRTAADVIQRPSLQIIEMPSISAWQDAGVTVTFRTNLACKSRVLFGESSIYSGQADGFVATSHSVTLEGLKPATIYHYQVICQETESLITQDDVFITKSFLATGQIQVFFNGSVLTDSARVREADGYENLPDRLIERIQSAQKTIDACFMKLTDLDVRDALADAHENGVIIRFICEQDELHQPEIQFIVQAGIPVLTDLCGMNDGSGIMHNKFAVFDSRDDTSEEDDWVWTGSFNPSGYGTEFGSYENAVCIQDAALAVLFTEEFDEMWGSRDNLPDPLNACFGQRKTDNIPHQVIVNGAFIEVFMSPSENASEAVEKAIASSGRSLCFSMYSFTRSGIAAQVMSCALQHGVSVFGLMDGNQIESDGTASQWPFLSAALPEQVRKYSGFLLHHKYAVVDGEYEDLDPVVITGSYNWTNSAENRNDENVLIIHDAAIADQYLQEFWARYGQNPDGLNTSLIPECWQLSQNFPNPFNEKTRICFDVPRQDHVLIQVLDIRGRCIRKLMDSICFPGNHKIQWDGQGEDGCPLSSGVFIISLESSAFSDQIKTVLLK